MGRIPTTVGLARGEGLVARFGDVVIYLGSDTASTERLLGAAETAAAADDPGVAIAQRLAATVFTSGSAQPPNFGVIAPTAGGILILLRGPVRALAEGPEGAHRLSGERAMTWTDEILRDPIRRLTITADGDKPIPHTDLRSGVVPAGGFIVRAPVSGLAAQSKSGSGAASTPSPGATPKSGSGAISRTDSGALPKPVAAEDHPAPDTTRRAPIPTPSRSRFNVPSSTSEPIPRATDTGPARTAEPTAYQPERGRNTAERAVETPTGTPAGSQHTTADLSDVAPAFAQTVGVFPDFPSGATPSGPIPPPGSSRTDATTPAPQNGTTGERNTGENATTQRRTPAEPAAPKSRPATDDVEPAVTQRDNRPAPEEQPPTAAFDALREAAEPDAPEAKPTRGSTPLRKSPDSPSPGKAHDPAHPGRSQDPAPLGRSQDPAPLGRSQDPAPLGRSENPGQLGRSRDSGPLGHARDSAPIGAPGARPGSSDRNPVVAPPETSALAAIGALTSSDGAVYPLDRPYVIGRDPMIDESVRRAAASPIVIPRDRHVSRVHAHITIENNTIYVRDAGTPGGTFVAAPGAQDWIRVGQRPVELKPGWSLRIGGRVLTYRTEQPQH
ncbi:FHA domain-containing protein [Nocardia sp. 2]|uniref:FHA domain-containing protein n=1 Tax=Nocardia acididurans TaxID=2802282 RepID=A0ABS1MFQ7_9NOCA|nr:FHA domain-containing protein [Nocardia acididurans]MBL1078549.1 FHA domain-containing protein [Nocardia acididurans]